MTLDWKLTQEDLRRARNMLRQEQISPLTDRNMFRGGIYCILTSRESYVNLRKRHQELMEAGFDSPEKIRRSKTSLRDILAKTQFSRQKERAIRGFAYWWSRNDLPQQIQADVKDEREHGSEFRDKLAASVPGLGMKCASLFIRMCGYDNVVPMDIWAVRYLRDRGHDVRIPGEQQGKGTPMSAALRGQRYREYETLLSEEAEKKGLSPAFYQLALWCKASRLREAKS